MAIGTGAAIDFFNTQSDLDSTSGSVTNGALSVAGDLNTFTNSLDAREASFILESTFIVTPTVGSSVILIAQLLDIEGTNDASVPTANYLQIPLGAFQVKNVTTIQRIPLIVSLPNNNSGQIYQFFIQNNAGQTMSAGWTIFETAKAVGSKA